MINKEKKTNTQKKGKKRRAKKRMKKKEKTPQGQKRSGPGKKHIKEVKFLR